jgi:hypothetical protein
MVPWLTNLHTRVVAEVGHFGAPASVVTDLTTKYDLFMPLYAAATDPETRTKAAITAKNDSKRDVLRALTPVMAVIQANPLVSDEQRVLLGLNPRDVAPSPSPVPDAICHVEVKSVNGWMAQLRLRTIGSDRRGLPENVVGANVYTWTGTGVPPTDASAWTFEGETSRADFDLALDPALPRGTIVYVTACFKNRRFQVGPTGTGVAITVGGGTPSLAEAA